MWVPRVQVVSQTCLALGLVFVGSADMNISGSIVEAFMDRSETDLKDSSARLMCLGLALLYLGQGEAAEGALKAVQVSRPHPSFTSPCRCHSPRPWYCQVIEKPIKRYLEVTIETCAYVGTSNVLQIQKVRLDQFECSV